MLLIVAGRLPMTKTSLALNCGCGSFAWVCVFVISREFSIMDDLGKDVAYFTSILNSICIEEQKAEDLYQEIRTRLKGM